MSHCRSEKFQMKKVGGWSDIWVDRIELYMSVWTQMYLDGDRQE